MVSTEMKVLESVGTVIYPNGMTYPLRIRNERREGCGIHKGTHLEDIESGDWWDALSAEDTRTVLDIYRKITKQSGD